jgi:hypothetical protein
MPTSRTIRNFDGSQVVATVFETDGLAAALGATTFAVRRFGAAAGFATLAGFGKAVGFGTAARFGDGLCFACFDDPLKTSDSQPA